MNRRDRLDPFGTGVLLSDSPLRTRSARPAKHAKPKQYREYILRCHPAQRDRVCPFDTLKIRPSLPFQSPETREGTLDTP